MRKKVRTTEDLIGKEYPTSKYGTAKVIATGRKLQYYRVKFLRTGHEDEFRKDAIIHGDIRDKYAPVIYGVGIIGNIRTKGRYKPYYTIWHNIMNRCYNPSYLDATVCERWQIFENFYADCKQLPGFDEALFLAGKLVLDRNVSSYSPDTCRWINPSEIQDAQQKPFIAYAPDGTEYHDTNITKFAKQHGLDRRHISGVLHNRCKTTQGWRFIYEEIV